MFHRGRPSAPAKPSFDRGNPSDLRKGGMAMVTHEELIQIGILIVAFVNLVIKIANKK